MLFDCLHVPKALVVSVAPSSKHVYAAQTRLEPKVNNHRKQTAQLSVSTSPEFCMAFGHSSKMAMQNTLGLPELIDNIISHLSERDIHCNAQRASRHW